MADDRRTPTPPTSQERPSPYGGRLRDRSYTRPFARFELPYPYAAPTTEVRAPRGTDAAPPDAERRRGGVGALRAAAYALVLAGARLWGARRSPPKT